VASFDSARFRKVLGHYPTGVTVVTSVADGALTGLTIGSFVSVSLEPPLVGFLAGHGSASWPDIRTSGVFCVNVLSADQAELCWRFAREEGSAKWDGVEWTASASGAPIIEGCVAWIDCAIVQTHDVGDHVFVVGRVMDLDHVEGDGNPLLFFQGGLGGFQPLA
jgi:flavin reductase (DIM6/NTAB) family NADH-FMN oxidoreductase RutF